jgi:D,D-heptose 1,7-bisphosphate phosphatase
MRVLILAGGFGTRLAHLVKDVPKPMAPIGGIPFVELLMDHLQERGATEFILLTGHMADVIESYFQQHPRYKDRVRFSRESSPLGTGGAVAMAMSGAFETPSIVVNGDTFLDCDLESLYRFHIHSGRSATLALHYQQDGSRYGQVALEGDRIVSFLEKSEARGPGLINAGVYVLSPNIVDAIPREFPVSLETAVFPSLLREGQLGGYPCGGRFIDIGIESDYKRAQAELPKWIAETPRPALFLDRDGVLVEDTSYLRRVEDIRFREDAIDFIRYYQRLGYLLIVCTNQAGIAKGIISQEEYAAVHRAIVAGLRQRGVELTDTFMCPDHPEGLLPEFTRVSYDRKPSPGMILKAAEKYLIDLPRSFMVGDKVTDRIDLPGLRSYLVQGTYPISGDGCYSSFAELAKELQQIG